MREKPNRVDAIAIHYATQHWRILFSLALGVTCLATGWLTWTLIPEDEPHRPTEVTMTPQLVSQEVWRTELQRLDREKQSLQTTTMSAPLPQLLNPIRSSEKSVPPSTLVSKDQPTHHTSQTSLSKELQCLQQELGSSWTSLYAKPLEIKVISFETEQADQLSIYRDLGRDEHPLVQWSGSISPSDLHRQLTGINTLTISFTSDSSVTRSGWEILIYTEGMKIEEAVSLRIDEQQRSKDGRVITRELNRPLRLFDSGGSKRPYQDRERIDFPVRFTAPVADQEANQYIINTFFSGLSLHDQQRELSELCGLAKKSIVKDHSFITHLIRTLKLSSLPHQRSTIIDIFRSLALASAHHQSALYVQPLLALYTTSLIKRLIKEERDINLGSFTRHALAPYRLEDLDHLLPAWQKTIMER